MENKQRISGEYLNDRYIKDAYKEIVKQNPDLSKKDEREEVKRFMEEVVKDKMKRDGKDKKYINDLEITIKSGSKDREKNKSDDIYVEFFTSKGFK